jgi:hypothetical protein
MKRVVNWAWGVLAGGILLGGLGCGGGIEEGVPADTSGAQGVPADQLPQLAPIIPPGANKEKAAEILKKKTAPNSEATKESKP